MGTWEALEVTVANLKIQKSVWAGLKAACIKKIRSMKRQFKPQSHPNNPHKKYRDHPTGAGEFFFLWTSCDFSSQAELCAFSKELGEQI